MNRFSSRAALLMLCWSCAFGATKVYAEDETAPQRPPGTGAAGRVYKMQLTPHWFAGDTRCWYRNDLRGGAKEFILVVIDGEQARREPAFDHQKLAAALSKAAEKEYKADKMPFNSIEFVDENRTLRFQVADVIWQCDLASYTCTKFKTGQKPPAETAIEQSVRFDGDGESENPEVRTEFTTLQRPRPPEAVRDRRSPDEKWTALLKEQNIYIRDAGGKEVQLTTNGTGENAYTLLSWSLDSKALVAARFEAGDSKDVYTIESSPKEGGRAKLHSQNYLLPGDKFTAYELWTFDLETKQAHKVETERFEYPSRERPRLRWRKKDPLHFTVEKTDRGNQRFRVLEVDALTGKTRALLDDQSTTFLTGYDRYLEYLDGSDEILYRSDRDGWRHLYLFDAKQGGVKQQVTKGDWIVRGVERVDEKQRQIWFRASGQNAGQDPYLIQYYRVNFDGTGLVALTEGDGTHGIQESPEHKYLIDTYSRIDLPPVHELRRESDGKLLCPLEKADTEELTASGWRAPEVFSAKGRDGKTDIWGVVTRPPQFDPNKQYPVIEDIYAGPQDSFVPKKFSPNSRHGALNALGFIVVQIDGMGTANRSKTFHDVCWKNLADAGFPDRILWLQALAKKYPYLDLTRVGIYGTSAGGQNAAGAVLFHPEFYKVAVASCGCHDNRMDKVWWNEQWMGYPVGPHYAASSNITHAAQLQGKLLLMVGELDTNVPPESTFRLVDALIKAQKDFDLLVLPGAGHTDGGPYGIRRRNDFFVRHLQGVELPNRNAK